MEKDNEFKNIPPKDHPFYELLSKAIGRLPGIFDLK
jgi:hypothetical protein